MPVGSVRRPLSPSVPRHGEHRCGLGLTEPARHITDSVQRRGGKAHEENLDKELLLLIRQRKELLRNQEETESKANKEEQERDGRVQQCNVLESWEQTDVSSLPNRKGNRDYWNCAWHSPNGTRNWSYNQQVSRTQRYCDTTTIHKNGQCGSTNAVGSDDVWERQEQNSWSNSQWSSFCFESNSEPFPNKGSDESSKSVDPCLPSSMSFIKSPEGHQEDGGDTSKCRATGSTKDKMNRWAPYPPSKASNTAPQKEAKIVQIEDSQVRQLEQVKEPQSQTLGKHNEKPDAIQTKSMDAKKKNNSERSFKKTMEPVTKSSMFNLESRKSTPRKASYSSHNGNPGLQKNETPGGKKEHKTATSECSVSKSRWDSCIQRDCKQLTVQLDRLPLSSAASLQSLQISTSTADTPKGTVTTAQGKHKAGNKPSKKKSSEQALNNSEKNKSFKTKSLPTQTNSTSKVIDHSQCIPSNSLSKPKVSIVPSVLNDSGMQKSEIDSVLNQSLQEILKWDQLSQARKKKLDLAKGMPRFGIEMVNPQQHGEGAVSQGVDDLPLCEGFKWESVCVPTPPTSASSLGQHHSSESSMVTAVPTTGHKQSSAAARVWSAGDVQGKLEGKRTEESNEKEEATESQLVLHGADVGEGDSSYTSGAEHNDTQGTGKKRRAAGDTPSAEISSFERKTKRRKIKSKKERPQVDQLLVVSLREEELNRSLHTVETSLTQAQATLQAAYMEVQRLLVTKQQITMERSTLRSKRIELVKGMQGCVVPGQQEQTESNLLCGIYSISRTADVSSTSPALSPSALSLPVREESHSPPGHSVQPCHNLLGSTDHNLDHLGPSGTRPHAGTGDTRHGKAPPSHKISTSTNCKELHGESTSSRPSHPLSTYSDLQLSSQLPEATCGKRVRKLKKKKMLKKAFSDEQAENSDTELDVPFPQRPVRKIKPRRRSRGSAASTSSSLLLQEEGGEEKRASSLLKPAYGWHQAESNSDASMEMTELPLTKPLTVVCVDSEPEDKPTPVCQSQKLACNKVTSTAELKHGPEESQCSTSIDPVIPVSPHASDGSAQPEEEDFPTEGSFEGHQAAVIGMQIHNDLLYTCSGDRTVRAFDLLSRRCVACFEGHNSKVNALLVSSGSGVMQCLYSGSSDQTIRCYSLETRELRDKLSLTDRVLCLHSRWKVLYAGLANGSVVSFSLKTHQQLDVFECHGPRAVSCVASAQEGGRRLLLVGSYDCTVSVRDAKSGLLLRTLQGHTKSVLCLKVVNDLVFSGSSDQSVRAYNIHTGEQVRVYRGHSHAVTTVTVSGMVMVTACLDKLVHVYNVQSRERLQVYGGHKDMVMCMALHRNMIYTGCYDGSVKAVKLNLRHNYRCWWHGCCLTFGVMDHLQQHVLSDHTSASLQTLRCRWKNCDAIFTTRNNSKQDIHKHLLKHVEEENKLEACD